MSRFVELQWKGLVCIQMSKKTFIVILVLSVVVTYGVAMLDFAFEISRGAVGLPFGFSNFNFFGSETNMTMLVIDIIFWFFIIWLLWKGLQKFLKR